MDKVILPTYHLSHSQTLTHSGLMHGAQIRTKQDGVDVQTLQHVMETNIIDYLEKIPFLAGVRRPLSRTIHIPRLCLCVHTCAVRLGPLCVCVCR